jgi:hypothetical protein
MDWGINLLPLDGHILPALVPVLIDILGPARPLEDIAIYTQHRSWVKS